MPPLLSSRATRVAASLTLASVLSVASLVPAAPLYAQEPDAAALKQARDQFRRAISLEAAGDWAGALSLLREVSNVRTTPQVRYNIGLCEENLGQLTAALGDYELALGDAEQAGATDVTQAVSSRLVALRERIPKVVIGRPADVTGAAVSIDGVALGAFSLGKPMRVDPGTHVVEARARGFEPFRVTFEIAEREEKTIDIQMTPLPEEAVVPAGQKQPARAEAADSGASPSASPWPWVIGGVGVAALATSGVFYALRSGTMSDLDSVCGPNRDSCPADSEDTFNKGETYTTVANIALGVGILGVGTGTVLFLMGPSSESASGTTVGIAPAGPGTPAGATVFGRF